MNFILDYYFDFGGTVFTDGNFSAILKGFGLTLELSILAGILALAWGWSSPCSGNCPAGPWRPCDG